MSKDVRRNPCASCPYRCDVPSGIWSPREYTRLPIYDGSLSDQDAKGAYRTFGCHQADGRLCAGWVGHRDPAELLALRVGVAMGAVDSSALDYSTKVPLFSSGHEAAEHGMAEIECPGDRAEEMIAKLLQIPGVAVEE